MQIMCANQFYANQVYFLGEKIAPSIVSIADEDARGEIS